jgi:hypothetical protein
MGLLKEADLRVLGDVDRGAFEDVPDEVLATAISVFRRAAASANSVALQPTPPEDRARDGARTARKRGAILAQVGRYEFDPRGFEVIEGEPVVYWWSKEFLARYAAAPKLRDRFQALNGLSTQNNVRFVRSPWEVSRRSVWMSRDPCDAVPVDRSWFPYIKGGEGAEWFEPLSWVMPWADAGIGLRVFLDEYQRVKPGGFIKHESHYFKLGVAFAVIGSAFSGRAHRFRSIFGHMGSSLFPDRCGDLTCLLNSSVARFVLQSLNPTVHFLATDVNRLPVFAVPQAGEIFATMERAFSEHEAAREPSAEYLRPTASPWIYAQSWAQLAVDRSDGAPVPLYEPVYDPATSVSFVSFALGIAVGRFGANGEGVLATAPASALPNGILFLSAERADSLDHPACASLLAAWNEHGTAISQGDDLRTYLRKSFFDFHKKLYENRPIYLPLSSAKKSFVAFVSIHRWGDDTLSVLLADHLVPGRRRLEGELDDLRTARASAGANKGKVEKRFTEVQKALEELTDFIAKVSDLAEKGPPPPDDKTTKREVDARYAMALDDGVMVNSAALWSVLEPQWKDPKKWWKELANATGKKDYDWSHLAARYFPTRVRAKCQEDPSLAVAHGCFWELHPAKAFAWELRLQDEIRPEFTIDEPGSDAARAAFLTAHAAEAREIDAKDRKRREKKGAKEEEQTEIAYEAGGDEEGADE